MKNVVVPLIIFAALILAYLIANQHHPTFTFDNKTHALTYVFTNQQQWEKGLMNTTITNSTFALFAFPNASVYTFWMKDTYTPLDMIWIDNNTVVYIANAIPCSSYDATQQSCILYNTNTVANYVIETRSGFVKTNNISLGNTLFVSP